MRRAAQLLCPLAAITIVVSTIVGVRTFNPEPEAATYVGWFLVTLLLVSSQLPLALAPYASGASRTVRTTIAFGMMPTAAVMMLIVVDLLPRLLFPKYTDPTMIAILVVSLCAYILGFVELRRRDAA